VKVDRRFGEKIASIFCFAYCLLYAGFFISLRFKPEGEGDKFHRNLR
jgi:hypothetical protein